MWSAGLFRYIQREVVTDPACMSGAAAKKAKTKTKMTVGESVKFLSQSAYIRNLAMLVICYGMSINIVEVTWKAKLKQARSAHATPCRTHGVHEW